MLRVFTLFPVPHCLLQVPHVDQADISQCTAQPCVLQASFCERAGQPFPLNAGFVVIVRALDFTPLPQSLLHEPHAFQTLTAQLIGQLCVLQLCDAVLSPQGVPPYAAFTATLRARDCEPVPQALLQLPHELQEFMTQFTGQLCVLQLAWADKAGHALPPYRGSCVMVRKWVLVPLPQALLQLPHPP